MYPLGKESKWGDYWELRYSLRSVEKYVNHENVYVVGYKPEWIKNIIHIPFKDSYTANKDANLISKIIYACILDISDTFIRMSDDHFFLKPYKEGYHINGNLKVNGESQWHKRCFNTWDVLVSEGKDMLNYDTHSPCLIDKKLYPQIMLQCPYGEGIGILVNSYYFNSINVKPKSVNIVKIKASQDSYDLDADCMNINEEGLTGELKKIIEKLFPVKSRYELP